MKPTPTRRAAAKPSQPPPPPPTSSTSSTSLGAQTDPAVIAFLHDLEHPKKPEIEAVRRIILDAAPEIREGIKWNAPSFCTREFFATFNLRTQDRLRVIFHLGAKVKDTPGFAIPDPTGLLEWLGKDRALVTLHDAADVAAKQALLQAIVRAWIRWL